MSRMITLIALGILLLGCSPAFQAPRQEPNRIEYGSILDVDGHIRTLVNGNKGDTFLHMRTKTGDEAEIRVSEGYLQISFSKCSGRNARIEKRIVDVGNSSGFIVIFFDSNVSCPNITLSRKWVSPEKDIPISAVLADIFKVGKGQRTLFEWKNVILQEKKQGP